MSGTTARRLIALLLVAILVVACIIEPPGPPSTTTDFQSTFTLTTERPVAIRTLEFKAVPGPMEVSGVQGHIEVVGEGGGGPGSPSYPDVWVSILNVDTGSSTSSIHGNGHASVDGWGHPAPCDGQPGTNPRDLAPDRTAPCTARWTVIARWLEPEAGVEIPLELNANMRAWARRVPASGEAFALQEFSITQAAEPIFDGSPAVASARVKGSATITPASEPQPHKLILRVPAELVSGEGAFPRLGRLFVSSTVKEWSGSPMNIRFAASFAGRAAGGYGGTAGEADWLSVCVKDEDCEIPIDLTISFWSSSSVESPPPDALMTVDWLVEARLEDFDPRATMPAGLELVEVP
jgi:hypothetical protein